MKKLILSAAVAFAGVVGMKAQSMESIQVGAKVGYNMATLRGDVAKDIDTKSLNGFNLGLFVEVPVNERFSIQPEVNYSTQGAKWEKNLAGVKSNSELKTQYINVPVLAKFYVVDGLSINAGPQLSFLTGSKIETSKNWWELAKSKVENGNFSDNMGKVDFGIVAGASYKTPIGLILDARYNFGLTNTMDENNDKVKNLKVSDGNDFKNGVFTVGVGYQF